MNDLISRQAAIDALDFEIVHMTAYCDGENEGNPLAQYNKGLEDGKKAIEALPSAQPEQIWILCDERMPEDLEEVNVTWVNHNPEPHYEFTKDKPFTATAVYYKGEWYWYSATCVDYLAEYGRCDWNKVDKAVEIVAWMPLPKPFEGGAK